MVEYRTAPEWIDELVFEYFVLSQLRSPAGNQYSLYT
jgi:hypothetical protein